MIFFLFEGMKTKVSFIDKHKDILAYGLSMGVLLLCVKWFEARFIVFNYQLDFLIASIAIIFTLLGIWLALKLVKPKIETHVIEKEVFIDNSALGIPNQDEIEKTGMSKRELDVLLWMSKGLSNEEIAEKLFISLNTVKTHSSNIFSKLDVKRRTQAVEKAKNLKII